MNFLSSLEDQALHNQNIAICLGNFDGLHKGHLSVVESLLEAAQNHQAIPVFVSFDPHPAHVLCPEKRLPLITSVQQKMDILQDLGFEYSYLIPFDQALSQMSPLDFVHTKLFAHPKLKAIVVGFNFCFGKSRQGNSQFLKEQCAPRGIELKVVNPLNVQGQVVSSSSIRALIGQGHVAQVQDLLGRSFAIQGTVVRGQGLGKNLGFPTANLKLSSLLMPGYGVYAVDVHLKGQSHAAVANWGLRPTIQGQDEQAVFEVHLLDFSGELYGQTLKVSFIEKIRDEQKFSSPEELCAAIARDCQARTLLP